MRSRHLQLAAACSALLAAPLVAAEPPRALDLARAVQLALATQPKLAAAGDEAQAAGEAANAHAGALLPQLRVRAGELFTGQDNGRLDFVSADAPRVITGQLVLGQWLFNLPLGKAVTAARAEASWARYRTLATRLEVAAGVTQAYFELEMRRAAMGVWEADVDMEQHTVSVTKEGLDAGRRARIDLARAQLALARAQEGLAVARSEEEAAAHLLALMTGLGTLPPLVASPPLSSEMEVPAFEALVQEAMTSQPELAMRRSEEERQAALLAAARGERLPKVEAEAAYGWETAHLPWNVEPGWSAGVLLGLPVFTGGTLGAEEAAARARLEAAHKRLEQAHLEVRQALVAARGEATSALAQYRAATASVPTREEVARISEEGYREGRLSSLDLLLARQELIQGRLAVVESAARLRAALATLQLLTGRLPTEGGT